MQIYSHSASGTKIIDTAFLLNAYCNGMFPMSDGKNGEILWFAPEMRGIIPLDALKVSRSLRQTLNKKIFFVRVNVDFEAVIRSCAQREDVWISEIIIQSYLQLHRLGFAHSVECWHNNKLVGGLYGVSIGGAFFGESMFSHMKDASKVALVHLVTRLNERKFVLLDCQYTNPHLSTLGCIEIPKIEYLNQLQHAIEMKCNFVGESL